MKKTLLFIGIFFLFTWSFTSCESIQKCKFCKTVTYENGTVTNEGPESEYCGADLIKQEAIPDIVIGDLVTKVECR
jgi:hypothetical protein